MIDDRAVEKLTRQTIELLKQEREAIIKGKYEVLKNINEKKADLVIQLENFQTQMATQSFHASFKDARRRELEAVVSIMKRRSEENQKLLIAARAGIKAARAHMNRMTHDVGGFGAYDSNGQQIPVCSISSKREQFI